jgi:hypothetical protein
MDRDRTVSAAFRQAVKPEVSTPPMAQTVAAGSVLSLSVTATGSEPLSYQWYKDGALLAGATASTYRKEPATVGDSGVYSVVVRNDYGEAAGAGARVVVEPFGRPRVFVNGVFVEGGAALTVTNEAQVRLETAFAGGFLFYTLDGSAPSYVSTDYAGPFALRQSARLRVAAYSADFLESAETAPIDVAVLPLFPVSVSTAGGGAVPVDPAGTSFASNSVIHVSARAASGWTFLGWRGGSGGAELELRVTAPVSLEAVFGAPVTVATVGNGTARVSPTGELRPYGSQAVLQAAPGAGS